jgi:hypothetical protein
MPGGRIDILGDPSRAIMPLQIPDVTAGTFQQTLNTIFDNSQKTTGATDYSMGVNRGSLNQTATGITQLALSANRRMDNMIFELVNEGLKPLVRSMMIMPQQFMTNKQMVKNKAYSIYEEIYPEDILDFDAEMEIRDTTITNKELIGNLYIQLLNVLAPYANAGIVNIKEIIRLALSNIPEAEKYATAIVSQEQPQIPQQPQGTSGIGSPIAGMAGVQGTPAINPQAIMAQMAGMGA